MNENDELFGEERLREVIGAHITEAVEAIQAAILTALAAWLRYVRGDNGTVDDPRAVELSEAWKRVGEAGIFDAVFGDGGLSASSWRPSPRDRGMILAARPGATVR